MLPYGHNTQTLFVDLFKHTTDVIYGRTEIRENYVNVFIKKLAIDLLAEAYGEDIPPGVSPSEEEAKKRIEKYKIYINNYNEPITRTDLRDVTNIRIAKTNEPYIAEYINALEQSKYALRNLQSASPNSIKKGDLDQKVSRDMQLSILAIRRACKFGIEYITNMPKNARVHYILDGIKMVDVIGKTPFHLYTQTRGVPITTSELRFIFRNWYRFKNNNRLLFYKNYQICLAPWLTDPDGWVQYAEYLLKEAKRKPGPEADPNVRNFNEAIRANNHKEAINIFSTIQLANR